MIIIARAMTITKMNTQISEVETEKLLEGYKDSRGINDREPHWRNPEGLPYQDGPGQEQRPGPGLI